MGYQGENLIYMDPHFLRPSISIKDLHSYKKEVFGVNKDLFSYHCETVRYLKITQMDPSMVVGFYIRDEEAFDRFCVAIEPVIKCKNPLFSLEEKSFDGNGFDVVSASDDDF
jgi:cysteine protease ATG4